ncbi:hypothetical protein [Bradyrhizobium sp.]|uniref:hypothetical protein n=1 Tax=Bradyrhizobium sp. TaxID=376 RepID=UPI0025BCE88A|nr:hypothetical protein [Bradyrhizobium sp.]
MVRELPPEAEPHLAPEMDGDGGANKGPEDEELRREETHYHGENPENNPVSE